MKHQDYFLLIHKKLYGNISPGEKELFNQWLNEDTENQETFNQLKTIWDDHAREEDELYEDEQFQNQLELLQQKVKDSKEKEIAINRARRRSWYLGAAVIAFTILSCALFVGYQGQNRLIAPTSIAVDQNHKVLLADHSSVVLNSRSSIVFSQTSHEREVKLEGEAFFDVAQDKVRPFCVRVNDVIIRAVGTSFIVKAYPNEPVEVIVISGTVEILREEHRINLSKDDKVIISDANDTLQVFRNEDLNFNSWYTHKLTFRKTPLNEIFTQLKRQYRTDFEVSNREVLDCRFTGIFDNESLDKIMKVLSLSLHFSYELNDDIYSIKGKGCKQNPTN